MDMKQKFEQYLKRLNVESRIPSIDLLREIQQKHVAEFTFNNISVLLGKEISLDIADIYDKIVDKSFGGYCFEHNRLMHDVLDYLGFDVRLLVARVVNNMDIDAPRTHRVTLLDFEGIQYLVDVGFGPKGSRAPIKINGELSVQNGNGYRIRTNKNQDFQLELLAGGDPFVLYEFNLNRYTESDCLIGNFYSYKHPKAVFVNNLVVSKLLPEITLSLRNRTYYKIDINGTESMEILDDIQLQQIIREEFDITLSDDDCKLLYSKIKV